MSQEAADAEPDEKGGVETVKVRNSSRRGLLIRVPGQALQLQPGGVAEVPRAFLDTGELAALVRGGDVLVLADTAAPRVRVKPDLGEMADEEAEESAELKPPRPSKRSR